MAARKRPAKSIVAAPYKGTEVTGVCVWDHVPGAIPPEVPALNGDLWSPRTIDFEAVADTPNSALGQCDRVEIRRLIHVESFIRLFTHDLDGNERPRRSLRRVNIIGHGQQRLLGLSGQVDFGTGELGLDPPLPPPPNSTPQTESEQRMAETRFDNATVHWLNHDGTELRDQIREKLTDDAEIALFLCYSGSLDGRWLMEQMADTFDAVVQGFTTGFGYAPVVQGNRIVRRNRTFTDPNRMGDGYPCRIPVPENVAGRHIEFTATAVPRGKAGLLAGRAAWIASHQVGHLPVPTDLPR